MAVRSSVKQLQETIRNIEKRLRKLESSRRVPKSVRGDVDACRQLCKAAAERLKSTELQAALAKIDQAHAYLRYSEKTQKDYQRVYDRIAKDLQATRKRMFKRDYPGLARRDRLASAGGRGG